jgi:hypothetical protein
MSHSPIVFYGLLHVQLYILLLCYKADREVRQTSKVHLRQKFIYTSNTLIAEDAKMY